MKRTIVGLGIGLVALTSVAGAADFPEPVPVVPALPFAYDWSGFYAGGQLGYAWGSSDWNWLGGTGPVTDRLSGVGGICGFAPATPGCNVSPGANGFVGGIYGGYQRMYDNFVFGGELAISGGSMNDSSLSIVGAADDVYETDINYLFQASLKAGFLLGEQKKSMAYIKGGYAGADVKTSVSDTSGTYQGSGSTSEWHNGWTIGGGFDYRLNQRVLLGLDYTYSDLSDQTHLRVLSGDGGTVSDSVDVDVQTLMGRVTVLFGGG